MVFKSASTLRKQLVHVKTKQNPDKVKGVIYSCGKVYIGETGRTLKDRLGEHKRAVTNGNTNNAVAIHILRTAKVLHINHVRSSCCHLRGFL